MSTMSPTTWRASWSRSRRGGEMARGATLGHVARMCGSGVVICSRQETIRGKHHEAATSSFHATGGRRRDGAGGGAARRRAIHAADLSGAAGARDRRTGVRQLVRHRVPADRPVAHRASRPAVPGRGSARRRRQYRDRSGRPYAARRLHDPAGERPERHQRHPLRQAQFQFRARHRAGGGFLPRAARHGGQPVDSRQDCP